MAAENEGEASGAALKPGDYDAEGFLIYDYSPGAPYRWPLGEESDIPKIPRCPIPGLENLPTFDLRNGDPADVRPIMVRATIPAAYHWTPVGGIAPEKAVGAVDAYIKSAQYQITTHRPPGVTDAQIRKQAIVLGTSRAVMTCHYRLTAADIVGGELTQNYLNVKTEKDGTSTYKASVRNSDVNKGLLTDPLVLDDAEKDVVSVLLVSAVGALPLQGYSLIMTGHHYLSEGGNQSRKAYAVVEKQFWNSGNVKTWFATDLAMLQDVAWHKAGHPVHMLLKEDLACEPNIAQMLRDCGAGSAAARLPAMEAPLRAANSYLALMHAVDPLFGMFGGKVDTRFLSEIVAELKSWPRTANKTSLPAYWPEIVTNRKEALSWLTDVLQKNAAKAAYCYGFYVALVEANQAMMTGGANDTLRTSYSLTKLRGSSSGAYAEGVLAYGDYTAARNRRKQEGKFQAATIEITL